MEIIVGLALFVCLYVFKGFHLGSLGQKGIRSPSIEGSVINGEGGGVQCGFCYGHPDKKAKEGEEKGRKTKV